MYAALYYRQDEEALWLKIEMEFNTNVISAKYWKAAELRAHYNHLCQRASQKTRVNKKHKSDTGGGKCLPSNFTPVDDQILAHLGARASGIKSKWDDDEGMYKIRCIECSSSIHTLNE